MIGGMRLTQDWVDAARADGADEDAIKRVCRANGFPYTAPLPPIEVMDYSDGYLGLHPQGRN